MEAKTKLSELWHTFVETLGLPEVVSSTNGGYDQNVGTMAHFCRNIGTSKYRTVEIPGRFKVSKQRDVEI